MREQITGVFEGGGVKGIALAGAAAAAMDDGYVFEQTVGTSAGAMVASLVAAGFGPGDLRLGDLECGNARRLFRRERNALLEVVSAAGNKGAAFPS